jgi:hypothetical protein
MGSSSISNVIKKVAETTELGSARHYLYEKPRSAAKESEAKAANAAEKSARQTRIAEDERIRRLRLLQTPGATSSSEMFTGRQGFNTLLGQ